MKNSVTRWLVVSLLLTTGFGATLEQLEKSFLARYDQIIEQRDQQLNELRQSYIGALAAEMDKAKATGKLERVVPFKDELELIEDEKDPVPGLPDASPYNLVEMRAKYASARQKRMKACASDLVELADKMEGLLKKRESELTRAGKIDEALVSKKMREALIKDEEIVKARVQIDQDRSLNLGEDEAWRPLVKEKMRIITKSNFGVGWLDAEMRRVISGPFLEAVEKEAEEHDILISHPPATIEFRFRSPVTELRARAFLASKLGAVEFRVFVDGKQVEAQKLAGKVGGEDISCRFKSTEQIILEVDQAGSQNSDWAMWIDPEVR